MTESLSVALAAIPDGLKLPLVAQFEEQLSDYRAGRWESVGLKAGKICEIIYSILAGHVGGEYPNAPSKPPNMVSACLALEQASHAQFSRSVRIQMPRVLIALYELRNNRSIGHVGSDVDPNHMDAEFFIRTTKWLVAELVRVFGALSPDAANELIEAVTEQIIPAVWEGDGIKRILNPFLSARDKALCLAYSSPKGVSAKDLALWSGYSNLSRFRTSILGALNKDALIHYDQRSDLVVILPTGVRHVESRGLLVMK